MAGPPLGMRTAKCARMAGGAQMRPRTGQGPLPGAFGFAIGTGDVACRAAGRACGAGRGPGQGARTKKQFLRGGLYAQRAFRSPRARFQVNGNISNINIVDTVQFGIRFRSLLGRAIALSTCIESCNIPLQPVRNRQFRSSICACARLSARIDLYIYEGTAMISGLGTSPHHF